MNKIERFIYILIYLMIMTQQIGAIVSEWLVEELDKITKAENRTRSNVIENILTDFIKKRNELAEGKNENKAI